MEINLSKYAGFCDGVKRAYDMVVSLDLEKARKPVFILGSLVHNPEVNRKIEKKGIRKITREIFFNSNPGEIGTVIITAHGTGPDIYEFAKKNNIDIFDTTCSKVIKVQRLAMVFRKRGYKIIIVGDKNHKEVRGIDDWGGGKSEIVSEEKDLGNLSCNEEDKIAILSQTTQNEKFFLKIGEKIKEKYLNAEIIDTTCNTTHERQEEIRKMAKESEAMIIIGSKTSANSKRLWEISKEINSLSYFIEKPEDIDAKLIKNIKNISITAGASTPDWIINGVLKKLSIL